MNTIRKLAAAALAVAGAAGQAAAHDRDGRDDEHGPGRDGVLSGRPVQQPVVVVDSTGRVMGRLAPSFTGQAGAVVVRYGQETLLLPLGTHAAANGSALSTGLNWSSGYLYHGGPNCTGQLYIPAPYGAGGTRAVQTEQRGSQWLLHVGVGGPPQPIPTASVSTGGKDCFNSNTPGQGHRVETTVSLDRLGIAPFFVR